MFIRWRIENRMNTSYILLAVLVSAIITLTLRAFPFLVFKGDRQMPEMLVRLGQVLPATVMAVLIVYCVKDSVEDWSGTGVSYLIGILTVGLSYKYKHNTLVSILLGTIAYMIMIRVIG